MKILLVNDYGVPAGGAEIAVILLRDLLRRNGHDARLLSSRAQPIPFPSSADYRCLGTTSPLRVFTRVANPWAHRALRRALKAFDPDVVHVNLFLTQLSPLILPPLRPIPAIYHVHWHRPVCPTGSKMLPEGVPCNLSYGPGCYRNRCMPPAVRALTRLQMGLWKRWQGVFDLVVANSGYLKLRLESEGMARVETAWYGVPAVEPRPGLSNPPTVAYAGRMVREKGVDTLLHAFAGAVKRVPDARLILVGAGEERGPIVALARALRLGSRMEMHDHLPRAETEAILKSAWVQAVPSRCVESFGLVAAEAMMRGTAVVASDIGGLREIVRAGETGLLVPPGDAASLAEALLALLGDVHRAEHMGRQGRVFARAHFDEIAYMDRFVSIYERVCGIGPP